MTAGERDASVAALAPYRVLDLTTERGWLCGKMLADLGADVVKVEPPCGDPGRRLGPFHGDAPGRERSLPWWFFNRGKRSITLDLDTADGRAILRRLLEVSSVLVESYEPGFMTERRLGYEDLADAYPSLVYTSITTFGQQGPKSSWSSADITLGASGGQVWLTGDPDRPPLRISVPQYALQGAAEAAVHTTIALYHAAATGVGQHVDVSCQLAVVRTLMNATAFPLLEGRELARQGGARAAAAVLRMIYPCADGNIALLLGGGPGVKALLGWASEEGALPQWLSSVDWEEMNFAEAVRTPEGKELFKRIAEFLEQFFAARTKEDLYEGALKRRLLLAPCNTAQDIRSDPQLDFRSYFTDVDHGDLGTLAYPGPWAKLTATPLVDTPRAPHVGEHTREILCGELGLSAGELAALSAAGVV